MTEENVDFIVALPDILSAVEGWKVSWSARMPNGTKSGKIETKYGNCGVSSVPRIPGNILQHLPEMLNAYAEEIARLKKEITDKE